MRLSINVDNVSKKITLVLMSNIQPAIDKAGSQAALARALGVTRQLIQTWKVRGVPVVRAVEIEHTLGVPKEITRPDVFKQ
jgi:DNA-binding transcriptional regulator YdaS (Cro superfamily)